MAEQQIISTAGSSSSSFIMVSPKKYDVFLSYRGEDTRMNFTSHLYEALKQNKVETYIDYRLEKGDEISPALIKAIEDSHISIVILSENYAFSKWCLEELGKILECKKKQEQIVIPVFHNIDPSHVRKQIGSYEKAFSKHKGESKCNKWKAALTEVANLAGWDSRHRTESEFLKDIVGDVLRKLTPRYPNQLKGLVGIEDNYEKIEALLKIGSMQEVLKYKRGTEDVEGIDLDLSKLTENLNLSSNSFTEMTNLRFLFIRDSSWRSKYNVYFPNGLDSLSYKLRYLHWDGFYLESLPSNFCAEKLVELRMPKSKVKKLWDGVQNLVNLKKINLNGSRDLIDIPDLSKAEKLESVSLRYCESLAHLHPSVLSLPKLTYLDLKFCRGIESLKVNSKSLCNLYLDDCSSLKEFSVTSEEMTHLGLDHTNICAFPSSIWCNRKLTFLSLRGCKNLESLSDDHGIRSITALDQYGCMQNHESNLSNLQTLLHNIGYFCFLEVLYLDKTNLKSLPTNIKKLSLLKRLFLDGCRKLVSLPELPQSLRELHVDNCTKLISLPELPPLVRVVRGINCTSLETNFTQQIVLQHMLQSRIPYIHKHPNYFDFGYFIFPVEHITDQCQFCTAEGSITIPYLPLSDLVGFIYCVILSKGSHEVDILCSIYQEGKLVGMDNNFIDANLNSDHVLFSFVKMKDVLFKTPFKFQFDYDDDNKHHQERIKEWGVFPVYSSESGFKLFGNSSMESFESESINQTSDNESEPRTIGDGVGGSNNENEQDLEQLLPEEKRRRICP
ncbi:hypothetical protein VNO78_12413 [Psophocarpus tetragonolobus]|uniref:TIR domain-containing protein n=1 Tax=Psophocarpus tetragonolobus TaxID=3891 RepID=A0AAN9SMZ0_PSOTE